jgi:hypothetical protein
MVGKDTPEARENYQKLFHAYRRAALFKNYPAGACDFCWDEHPVWEYPCADFEIDTPFGDVYVSEGAWAACRSCGRLIEADDRLKLVNAYLAAQPRMWREVIRPWATRLQNQFFRYQQGDRSPAPDYTEVGKVMDEHAREYEAPQAEPGSPLTQGSVTVMSAEDPNAPPDVAARVRESGEPAMFIEGENGEMRLVAEGDEFVDEQIERRVLLDRYGKHPLMDRYFQHMKTEKATRGIWTNSEPWHALAEKYVVTFAAANSLGIHTEKPGSFFFDPAMLASWSKLADFGNTNFLPSMGMYVTKALHNSVPYLWLSKVDELANEPDLPTHHVTRGLTPHPAMFWSFQEAYGLPDARIDWMLVLETARGYELWFPLADDITQDGKVQINCVVIGYGKLWPNDFGPTGSHSITEFFLKRIAFLNSKYVETPRLHPHRNVRRDIERQLEKQHQPPPDDLSAFVVHLRAPEPKPARHDFDGPMRDFERKHCWWRRAHTRTIWRNTPRERAVYVSAALCGDPELPLIRKTYLVER